VASSGLVRPRMDTNRFRSSSDRRARKYGGKCGGEGSDRLRASDVHGCDDVLPCQGRTSACKRGRMLRPERVQGHYACHCAGWLADSEQVGALVRRKRSCLGRHALHDGATCAQVSLDD
jgi:hypothetical protein